MYNYQLEHGRQHKLCYRYKQENRLHKKNETVPPPPHPHPPRVSSSKNFLKSIASK